MKDIKDKPRNYPNPGWLQNIFPTLKEIWKKADALKTNNDNKREKRSGGRERNKMFCICFSRIWRENI